MLPQAVWPRGIARRLRESLADTPLVLLNGPRQSGKPTLVRQFAVDERRRPGRFLLTGSADVRTLQKWTSFRRCPTCTPHSLRSAASSAMTPSWGARIGLDGKTVSRYLTILERLFLVRRV